MATALGAAFVLEYTSQKGISSLPFRSYYGRIKSPPRRSQIQTLLLDTVRVSKMDGAKESTRNTSSTHESASNTFPFADSIYPRFRDTC